MTPEQVRTVEILEEWVLAKEISVSNALKMFRDQYKVGLDYVIRNKIYARLDQAAGKVHG